jgi:hypothetical protein
LRAGKVQVDVQEELSSRQGALVPRLALASRALRQTLALGAIISLVALIKRRFAAIPMFDRVCARQARLSNSYFNRDRLKDPRETSSAYSSLFAIWEEDEAISTNFCKFASLDFFPKAFGCSRMSSYSLAALSRSNCRDWLDSHLENDTVYGWLRRH